MWFLQLVRADLGTLTRTFRKSNSLPSIQHHLYLKTKAMWIKYVVVQKVKTTAPKISQSLNHQLTELNVMLKQAQYLFGQCPLPLQHPLWYVFVPTLQPNLGQQVFFSLVRTENPESGPCTGIAPARQRESTSLGFPCTELSRKTDPSSESLLGGIDHSFNSRGSLRLTLNYPPVYHQQLGCFSCCSCCRSLEIK